MKGGRMRFGCYNNSELLVRRPTTMEICTLLIHQMFVFAHCTIAEGRKFIDNQYYLFWHDSSLFCENYVTYATIIIALISPA